MPRVETRHKITKKLMTFDFDFGSNLQDAIDQFGEASVFNRYIIGAKTSARNRIFALGKAKNSKGELLSEEEIKERMSEWSPQTPEKNASEFSPESLRKQFEKASPEKQEEMRAALTKMLGEKK